MDIFRAAERLMGMDDTVWARHANDWSVYSRIAGGLGIYAALASAHWIGWWALLPLAAVAAWTWANPRLFAPPATAEGWAQKGVLGERAFLNRHSVPVPQAFVRAGWLTTALTAGFAVVAIYGLVVGDLRLGATAWIAALMAKIWFVDRCVWLWEIMQTRHPVYAAWARAEWQVAFDTSEHEGP